MDLTELHGLLQGGLLIHLSKDMPEVSGLKDCSQDAPPHGCFPGGTPALSQVPPPGLLIEDQLAMPRSCLWPRDFTFGCRGWGGLGVTLGGGRRLAWGGKRARPCQQEIQGLCLLVYQQQQKKALLMLERG